MLRDLKTLYHLCSPALKGDSHGERLESFYKTQASDYDLFRERLLPVWREFYRNLQLPKGGVWIEMGAGTGANLEHVSDQIPEVEKVYLVDFSESLLKVAADRVQKKGWKNVEIVKADVTEFSAATKTFAGADLITFSYSLTIVPSWFKAIDRALRLRRHSWWTRTFWPIWFAFDQVHLSANHMPYSSEKFKVKKFEERTHPLPYVSFLGRVPSCIFEGEKA